MFFHFRPIFKKGFTLIEALMVIAILAILAAIVAVVFISLSRKSNLENSTQEIINIFRLAQSKTISSEGASQYGVYFDTALSPNQYTLFKGGDYAGREAAADIIQSVSRGVEIYEINLSGSSEVVFSRVSGEAFPAGNIKLRSAADPSRAETIYIQNSGRVGLVDNVPPAETAVQDSRHVHLDLGWSILDAAQLKFYFPDAGQTEIVAMAGYFLGGGTEFSWEGEFTVAGNTQHFKVHTHLLDPLTPPFTQLCVHRDRNGGKNNQRVIIYINDSGMDKEIITYQNDADDNIAQGPFAQSLMRQ